MSLLEQFARPCVLLKKTSEPDREGGRKNVWKDGEPCSVCLALDTSMEARKAEKQGVTSLYSALTDWDAPIAYNDYFRDVGTGHTYRVTSEPSEKCSPGSASFALKSFTAERKELPE